MPSPNIRLADIYPAGLPTQSGQPPTTQQASGQVPGNQSMPSMIMVGFIGALVLLRLAWEHAK